MPPGGRVPLPAPFAPRSLSILICALVLGVGISWCVAAAPAQAVPATAGSTTTVFALSGGVKAQVDTLAAQAQAVQTQIDTLDSELDKEAEDYNQCLDDIDSANARMWELRRMVADAQTDKAHQQALLAERIKSVYMSGGRDQLLQLLLLANGMEDLYNRVRLVAMLADQDQRLVANLKSSATRLDLLEKAVDEQKSQQLAVRQRLSQRATEIQTTLAERQATLDGLDARVKTIVEQEQQRQAAEQARLRAELQARLQAAQVAVHQGGPTGSNVLKPEQIALAAQKAGFTGNNLVIAVAVALAESSGNANAKGDVAIGGSFGLWQIYCVAHPNLIPPSNPNSVAWNDPYQNAQWAYRLSGGSNWMPWSTYIHGTYQNYMSAAQAAVRILIANSL
jgi:peptidoglycan hydrolase CwlO-like protein